MNIKLIKDKIATGHTLDAIQLMKDLPNVDKTTSQSILMQEAAYNRHKREYRDSLMRFDDWTMIQARVNNALLQLLEEMYPKEFQQTAPSVAPVATKNDFELLVKQVQKYNGSADLLRAARNLYTEYVTYKANCDVNPGFRVGLGKHILSKLVERKDKLIEELTTHVTKQATVTNELRVKVWECIENQDYSQEVLDSALEALGAMGRETLPLKYYSNKDAYNNVNSMRVNLFNEIYNELQ